jgi:uncharacterized protein (TIGR02453 family)
MSAYFTDKTFKFLRGLARHNEREWFQANKADYEQHLRQPFQRLIADLQLGLLDISKHYRADPKGVGGSLFRIHRDARFSKDKTPYKPWSGARFFHARSKQIEAPSFYLHVQPGHCFLGGGLWHPEPETQRKVRHFLFENPGAWKAAVRTAAFRRKFTLDGDSLSRPPRGFPAEHELIADIKRKDFVATMALDDAQVLGPRLRQTVLEHFRSVAPLIDYLCAALNLEF